MSLKKLAYFCTVIELLFRMTSKTERLLVIKELINSQKVPNQEELIILLEHKGFPTTQATLSRDLKFLKAYKVADSVKGYIYAIEDAKGILPNDTAKQYATQGFVSMLFANNLGIIKTLPGYAASIASIIDTANPMEVVGTIAGDDTILIIPADGVFEKNVRQAIRLIVPELG